MKKCSKCGEIKEFILFYKNRKTKDKLSYWCKKCADEKRKELHNKNPEKRKESDRKRRAKNRELLLAQMKKYYKNNKNKMKAYYREYNKNNRHKKTHWDSLRQARKKDSIPNFVKNCTTEVQRIKKIYKLSSLITTVTGVPHHVDHMWPLADGGPHWSGNLQIIPAKENLSKQAKVDPAIKATIQEMLAEEERLHAER